MKRALKKRVKAVLNNTPNSDGVPVVQLNEINHKPNRRAGTQAAMIGLAISMGATSLLVTRQSDQAQAAAPVGSQKAASTIPSVSGNEIKFTATKLESQAVSSASVPENPVILEPTAVSQVPGLEAKWPVAAKEMAVQISVSEPEIDNSAIYLQPQVGQRLNSNSVQSQLQADKYLPDTEQRLAANQGIAGSQTTNIIVESANTVSNDVNVQLKAQQEFALNRLQQKSNRLRNSLAELRSEETQNVLQTGIEIAQPITIADNKLAAQSENLRDAEQASLISKLKQEKQASVAVQKEIKPSPATPKVVAQSSQTTYEVKPGDTLAEIASNYGTSVPELVKANNLQDPNQLQISQQLLIPANNAGRSSYQATVPTRPTFFQSGSSSTVANYPVTKPNLESNLAQVSRSSVVDNNSSVAIPVPVVKENQLQINTPATNRSINIPVPTPEESLPQNQNTEIAAAADGIGGDTTPFTSRIAKASTAPKQPQPIARAKGNERLRSLQAEIERLREKYRAQQSGSGVVISTVAENSNAGIPINVEKPNEFRPSNLNSQLSSVAIPVPKPILPSYSEKQKPLRTARVNTDEPINPEFLKYQAASIGNSSRSSSGIKLVVPPAGLPNTDSLGKLRGTTVSPKMPPLASVDIYLPKAVDENTNVSAAYIWPAKGVLTSGYGRRWGRMHRGIDIANSTGTPIYASASGVVEKAGWNSGGYGNLVDIRHTDGSLTRYGHNSRILVQPGQQVEQGDTIATMGSTGFSTGPHTHFEVHPSGKGAVNPIAFLQPRI